MRKVYIAVVMVLFLLCLVLGGGWLTAKRDLEASQIIAENLKAENGQYTLALNEANHQIEMANQQISLGNANLKKKLKEEQNFGSYWWEKAHPKQFESLEELQIWLAQDDSDSTLYIFGSGCLATYDCDDYAVALMNNALEDGYLISTQLEGDRMINSTIIGNKIYFIEPQTDEVWFWGNRDRIK